MISSVITNGVVRWRLLIIIVGVMWVGSARVVSITRADDPVPDASTPKVEPASDEPAKDEPASDEPAKDDAPPQPDAPQPETPQPETPQPSDGQTEAEPPPTAAAALPQSFDALRPILFFQGQGSGLIPESFRPIAISQLDTRLSGEGAGAMSVFEKPQLNRAVYVVRLVDSALVSNQTTWEISHGGDSPVSLSLGKIGLALQSAGLSATTGAGYRTDTVAVVTQPDGTASVDVQGDTKLTLAWTAAGQETEREIMFDLAFPRSEQARWLIEVPQGMRLQSLDGVSQSLPSPPPEAGNRDSGRGSWYAIEAGGLDRLRVRVLKLATGTGETEVVVRQASFQYELSPAVMRFSCRLSIDPPADGVLPPLQISGGRVTAITVGGASAPWNETTATGTRLVRIRQDRAEAASNTPIAITIDGEAAWDTQSDLQPLPWIRLRECVPIVVGNQVQVKVLVDSRLTLLRLETPAAWRYLAAVENDGLRTTYRLGGPWDDAPPMVGAVSGQGQAFAESLLRLSATESRFRATWESSVSLASLGPQPIRLRVDAGWTAESVLLPLSGRAVDLPPDFATRREIVIWPTADELTDGYLKIRVTGSRPFRIEGDWARYPATSFVTFAAGRNRFAALVTPPAGFRWDAEASLQNNRIELSKLTPLQRQMVDTLPTDALLLDITQGRIMSLGSRRPAAAFNVSSLMTISLANDSVVETHTIKCESASGELDQIRVEFSAGKRADVEWSVNEKSSPTRRLIRAKRLTNAVADDPATRVSASPSGSQNGTIDDAGGGLTQPRTDQNSGVGEMPREIWDLELERSGSRGVVLIGRRESSLAASGGVLRLELPSVLGANSRLAQIFIPATFDVIRTGEGVLKVPRLVGPDLITGAPKIDQQDGVTLRYDSSATNWIEVALADPGKRVAVLWHESVDIIASGRGGDWITATYGIDVGSTLLIRHDAELRLASVTDADGAPLGHESLAGQLSIPLDASTKNLIVRWSRPAASFEPARKWSPPRIAPVAVVLRRDWRLTAAPDTWIPDSLAGAIGFGPRHWFGDRVLEQVQAAASGDSLASVSEYSVRIEPTAKQGLWLVDRSTALCSIAILGFVLFSIAWMLVAKHPVLVGTTFVISVCLVPGLPVGWIYWIAAVCVPLAAGGLVGSTLVAIRRDQVANDLSANQQNKPGSSARFRRIDVTPTVDAEQRYRSAPTTERLVAWLLALLVPIAGSATAYGQPLANRPIVLVPTKSDGTLAGDKVYISQTFFNELFREKSISVAPPLITSAVYRLRLDGMTESGMPTADWEIRYSLANLAERSEIYLPFKPSQVRSVQWLPGGEAKPLRWIADGDSRIRVSLPPTSSAAMLVRLSTDVQSPERLLRRIQLSIPAVTAASLVVDSGTAVQRFETSGAIGQTTSQPESGRLSTDLGPTATIDLTVTLRQGARGIPAIAARRYWVHASGDRCQVECEVDPGTESLRRGTDLPIVILGGQPAILTSRDWSIHSSEMISPQRQLLTCRSLRDSAGPIRLMWNLDIPIAEDEATAEAAAFQIPDVISAGSAPTPDALMAIQTGDGYRVLPFGLQPDTASGSPDAIDAFVSQWTGFRHTASQVIRSTSPLVRFAVVPNAPQPWTSNERHHLHVRQGEMRLTLDAVITRGAQAIGPLRLAFPKRLEIRELSINGAAVSVSPHSIAGRSEVAIPEPIGGEKLNVRVVAHQRLGTDEVFSPPRIRIVPVRSITGTYTFTRDQGLRVEQIRATDLPELNAPALDIADQLLSGYFPCWTWQLSESTAGQSPSPEPLILLDGSFRAEQRASRVDSVQRTAIRWTQSRWMLDVLIQVRARGPEGTSPSLLDDLNIELPTAWSDQLMVEPAEAWSSQPAIDPAMKVIRIRPDAQSRAAGVATLRLQALRIGEADSLLEVPTVRVMGTASTQTFMSVPQTASGRPLIWQTQSAVAENLPAGLENDEAAAAGELVFRALSNRATVRLQPSRPDVTVASATLCDLQLFPQPDSQWLAIIRWDVEPGDSKTIPIEVPVGVVPLAVWASGRTVPLAEVSNDTSIAKPTNVRLDVPMTLSQLAQPIVMLCQLRSPDSLTPPSLPTLAGVDVNETWLTLYKASGGSNQSTQIVLETPLPQADLNPVSDTNDDAKSFEENRWIAASDADRLIALAQSVIDVTESSISGATDRPQEELIAWLATWDQRFFQLRAEAAESTNDSSATFGLRDLSASNPLALLDGSQAATDPAVVTALLGTEPNGATVPTGPWPPLVDRWGEYVRRVTGIAMVQDANAPPAMMPSERWAVAAVAKHAGVASTIPIIRNGGETSTLMLAINLLIASAFIVGGGLLAWIFRKQLVKPLTQPAVWLLAVGLASLAVTPIPVAVAICVVAITAPLLNVAPNGNGGKTRMSRSRTQPKPMARV